jgi:hypothetical protein
VGGDEVRVCGRGYDVCLQEGDCVVDGCVEGMCCV